MPIYMRPSIKDSKGDATPDNRRIIMNTPIILFLAGFLYVAILFVWRFRCMKGKNPNTELFILAWTSFSPPNTKKKGRNK
jgi:hypothetical protein